MENNKICCFSGHRRICDEHFLRLPELLSVLLDDLVSKGFRHFRAGGAVGFDTLCALKCLELKKKYPELNITLELCLPCRDQAKNFSDHERNAYNFVLSRADKVTYEEEVYVKGCMLQRNRSLVNGAHLCVAYLSQMSGGTAYTYRYAKEKGVRVINLFEKM